MAVHQPVHKSGVYFITFTCYRWLPLISGTECYDTIFKFFDVLGAATSPSGQGYKRLKGVTRRRRKKYLDINTTNDIGYYLSPN